MITHNAHTRTHANSEPPRATPSDLPNTPGPNDPPISPVTSPTGPFRPAHLEDHIDHPEDSPPHPNAGGPEGPNRDPDPLDDGPNGRPDRDDGDQQSAGAPDNDDPFETYGGADNLTVQDLLCILGPILVECRGAPHMSPVAPPNPRWLKVNSPEEFNGHSPKKLKSFLISCNHAFRTDPDTFCSHDKRVSYVLSYLCGSATLIHNLKVKRMPIL